MARIAGFLKLNFEIPGAGLDTISPRGTSVVDLRYPVRNRVIKVAGLQKLKFAF